MFLHETSIVWERLEDIDGGWSTFVDGDFAISHPVGGDFAGETAESTLRAFEAEMGQFSDGDPAECVYANLFKAASVSGRANLLFHPSIFLTARRWHDSCKRRKTRLLNRSMLGGNANVRRKRKQRQLKVRVQTEAKQGILKGRAERRKVNVSSCNWL